MKSLRKIKAEMEKLNAAMGAGRMESNDYSKEISKLEVAVENRKQRPRWKLLKASKKQAALPSKKGKKGK